MCAGFVEGLLWEKVSVWWIGHETCICVERRCLCSKEGCLGDSRRVDENLCVS